MRAAQKEEDIFSLQGPEWAPSASTGAVRLLEAAQGALLVATAKGGLLRLSTAGGPHEEVELPRAAAAPQAVFVDPHTAHALILSTAVGDNFYVFRSKCRPLSKMKGVHIASVAWMPPRPDPSKSDVREVRARAAAAAANALDPLIWRRLPTPAAAPTPAAGADRHDERLSLIHI